MREEVATLMVASGALLAFAPAASSFSVEHPKTGECRQILVPGPTTFPGYWEVVSSTPAEHQARGTGTGTRTTTPRWDP